MSWKRASVVGRGRWDIGEGVVFRRLVLLFRGYGQMRGYEAWGRGDGSERRERILGGGLCVCSVVCE